MTLLTQRTFLISFLLILAISLSYYSFVVLRHTTHTTTKNKNQSDAFMEEVSTVLFNKFGTPSIKISTPRVTHFPENDASYIELPQVTLFRNSPNPWLIHSKFAQTKNGSNEIIFNDHVVIHHVADIANPTTTLQTQSLTVFPAKQIAKTNDPVVITQPDTVVHAIGMLANFEKGTVKLLSHARGEYAPRS